jgi:hypothetical protein
MSTESQVALADMPAAEIARRLALGGAACAHLADPLSGRDYLGRLMQGALRPDAVRVAAAVLPKREAVRWAGDCVRQTDGQAQGPAADALAAAAAWVADPSEEHRKRAWTAANAAGLDTLPGLVALAAFATGGSLAPDGAPVVPPPEEMTARTVAGAVLLAAVARQPERADAQLQSFLDSAVQMLDGGRN